MTMLHSRNPHLATLTFFLAAVILLVALHFFAVIQVTGQSMNPTLRDSQYLLQMKYLTHYRQGDVVVIQPPDQFQIRTLIFVKRLIALPDDSISIQNNQVILNQQMIHEPYISELSTRAENFPELLISKGEVVAFEGFALSELPDYLQATLMMLEPLPKEILEQSQKQSISYVGSVKLKEDFYFVLGDNRAFGASEDSRLFGAIEARSIKGKIRTF